MPDQVRQAGKKVLWLQDDFIVLCANMTRHQTGRKAAHYISFGKTDRKRLNGRLLQAVATAAMELESIPPLKKPRAERRS